MKIMFVSVLTIILALAAPLNAYSATVDGLAAYRGDFLSGVKIYALKSPAFNPAEDHASVSGPTDESGRFTSNLEQGKYYFIAFKKTGKNEKAFEAGDYFCFYSGNPVRVSNEKTVHIGFNMIRLPDDGQSSKSFTGIQGEFLFEDSPLGRSYLYIYRDASDEFRGMGFYVAPVGLTGRFKVRLPPGRYYLIGRKRQAGGMYGPLKKNDKVGYYYANPVSVEENQAREIRLELISRVEMLEEIWFEKESAGAFVLKGTIRDKGGKPLDNVHVLLYDNEETAGKPRVISPKTGNDGIFRMEIYDEGKYYIVSRQNLGGPPAEKEYYGRYEDGNGRALPVILGPENIEVSIDLRIGFYSFSYGQ